MPLYQFQVPFLGTVSTAADTEACARLQVGESLGIDPDHLALVDKTPGAPVFEGDPRRTDCLAGLSQDLDLPICDCSECEPDLVRVPRWQAWLGGLALGAAILLALRRT